MNEQEFNKFEYYVNRTFKHINYVQRNALILVTKCFDELDISNEQCEKFLENIGRHDVSKFNEIQFKPYLEFSWAMKNKEELTDKQQKEFDIAWENHYTLENHHLENGEYFHGNDNRIILLEIVCDLQAMADEFGERSCRKYFNNVWKLRQYKAFADDVRYQDIINYMEKIICCFEDIL